MLNVGGVRIVLLLTYVLLVTSVSGCKLALNRELSTAAQTPAPAAFSALGVTGGSDVQVDAKLTDGLVPTLNWTDSTGETSYELRILDSTGTNTICGPVTLAEDTTSYTFNTGCSLSNGLTYKADVRALWTSGTLSSSTSAPSYSFQTGPFVSIASSTNTQEYGVASVTVSLSQAAAVPVSVSYVTADQTAFGGADYVDHSAQTVTFLPGETTTTISVPILSNREKEGDRAFLVELSSSTGGSLESSATGTVTIQDDDLDIATGYSAVAAGGYFSCGLLASGGVRCWGSGFSGQLGTGTSSETTPADVTGLSSGVLAIGVGYGSSCALLSTGGVRCWGTNSYGQLGNGSLVEPPGPVNVTGLSSGVIGVASGGGHSCALLSAGGVKCWGYNANGQVGDGSTTQRTTPVDVSGLASGVSAIAVGGMHSCALLTTGAVRCWGANAYGQLGDGTTTQRVTSVAVSGLSSGVSAITAGTYYTCALLGTGAVKCWGYNGSGQLGDNSITQRLTPVDVVGLSSGVMAVAAGLEHACAVLSSGAAKCWGYNEYGQLGDGTAITRLVPVDVLGISSGATQISAGDRHSCARLATGTLKCWGENTLAQLGNGSTADRPTPVSVDGLSTGVSQVASGGNFTCAVRDSGAAQCWGNGFSFGLGDGSSFHRNTPANVSGLSSGVSRIAAGPNHACALLSSGAVKCWGGNWAGALGDGSTTDRSTPVDVTGLSSGVIAITVGELHSCALLVSGSVKCWGANWNGALGDGSTTDRLTPVDVSGLASGVIAIDAGGAHTCAVLATGAVKCWGENWGGAVGDNSTTDRLTPVDVVGLSSGVTAVSLGLDHSCARLSTGGVKCWGTNGDGQLGDNSGIDRLTPVDVFGLTSGVESVDAGPRFTCAVLSSGAAKCWGLNDENQLGDNSTTRRFAPVDVLGLASGVASISASGTLATDHACALLTSGGVQCWGGIFGFGLTPYFIGDKDSDGIAQYVRTL
jgi:alpha-tubulin suppressor-like RCC1 family protein